MIEYRLATDSCSKCRLRPRQANHAYCRECSNAYMRANRKPLSDWQRQRANCRSYTKTLQARGTLPKGPCEACGNPEAQNHHPDYTNPRYYIRLCAGCHDALTQLEL